MGGQSNLRNCLSERLCLGLSLGIVLMLAFQKELMFFQAMFYPLPDSRTDVILFSSFFHNFREI